MQVKGDAEMYPEELLYSKDHEWIRREEEDRCRLGITAFAQDELGDVVFVELPEIGRAVAADDEIGTIESVKAVAEIYSPVTAEVVAVNEELLDAPEKVNEDPYGMGWLVELRYEDEVELEGLMDAKTYEEFVRGGG
jgi:glycine cleavage system H protein